ncbi:hypothetical protein P9E09_20040 [Bacillus mojavensis]|uniref:hypothetical protein n=1 Tax=Bacillus mojavensis TaxID=72360 RepID=UPI002DC061DA|nr:hypothetical protein [Bacillus mojavensis]MEC1709848.1 hypothetical protein [Bacillus mojavensis]
MREDTYIDEQSAYEFISWYFKKDKTEFTKKEFNQYLWFYDNKNKEYVLRKKCTGQYAIPVELFDKWQNHLKSQIEEPPLGVIPKWLHDEHRIKDLKAAINRYLGNNHEVSAEWIDEYNLLVKSIRERKTKV